MATRLTLGLSFFTSSFLFQELPPKTLETARPLPLLGIPLPRALQIGSLAAKFRFLVPLLDTSPNGTGAFVLLLLRRSLAILFFSMDFNTRDLSTRDLDRL